MKTTKNMLTVVTTIAAIAVLVLANSANAAQLLDEDFQTPLLSSNTASPGFAGWTYNNGGAVKSRIEDSPLDIPGDTGVASPNQVLQLEWISGKANYDLGHNWAADDVFTLTFNASPQAWNLADQRYVRPMIYQTSNGAVLWDPGENATTELPTATGYAWNGPGLYGDSDWQSHPESLYSFTINASDFAAGAEGENIALRLGHSGQQRGMYYDNVSLALADPQGEGDIPEPVTMALLGLAACGLGGYIRRRKA